MGYLMMILFLMGMKEKYDRVHSELAGSFTCLYSRKMENGWWWEGERTRKRTCRVERRHKRRLFQQNDWPLTVDKKRKEERRKANIIIVTSLLKIFKSRIILSLIIRLSHLNIIRMNKTKLTQSKKFKFELFFRFNSFFEWKKKQQEINNNLSEKTNVKSFLRTEGGRTKKKKEKGKNDDDWKIIDPVVCAIKIH
jgi:hypothetical protein